MSMSAFEQAFANARKQQGAGGQFDFNGQSYSTNYAEEQTSGKALRKQAAAKELGNKESQKPPQDNQEQGNKVQVQQQKIQSSGSGEKQHLKPPTPGGNNLPPSGDPTYDTAAQVGGQAAADMFGGPESDGGAAAGGAVEGGVKGAKFGPVGAVVGAVAGAALGLMGAKEAREARKLAAEAEGDKHRAAAEAQKGEIQGQMSKAFSNTLLSGTKKVSL